MNLKRPMRCIATFLILLALTQAGFAQPESATPRTLLKNYPQHVVIINSLKFGAEWFNARYNKSISIFITARGENLGSDVEAFGYNGLAGELQYRKYLNPMQEFTTGSNRKFYRGVYAGGFAQGGAYRGRFKYESTSGFAKSYDYSENIGNWAAGFMVGYQRSFWQVIFIDAHIGGGIQWSHKILSGRSFSSWALDSYAEIGDPDFKGVLPKFGLSIGIPL